MSQQNYLTLQDGINQMLPKAFSAMVKPVGSVCNLNCTYCYYLDKERFYGKKQERLSLELLEQFTAEYISANQVPAVTFTWHGGEPLLAGIDYYKKALEFQRKHNPQNKKIENALQTNGTLLDDQWCKFFRKNNFLIGLSLDGPQDLHDAFRRNKAGAPTFDKVIHGLNLLKKHQVEFNTLSVVNRQSEGRGAEIYEFLKSQGVRFMQFLPCVDYIKEDPSYYRPHIVSPMAHDQESVMAPWSVSPEGYGRFLIDVFDKWVIQDVGQCFVQLFDMTLSAWYGMEPPVCAYAETCGNVMAVEHNGDVYSCDHFVFPEHMLGNLHQTSLAQMLSSPQQFRFGINKRNTLSRECLRCPYYFACKGECPKHRHQLSVDGELKFTLCEGIKMYYKHTEPYMKYMRDLLKQEKAPAFVMPFARVSLGKTEETI